jgi:hypothetical protein
MALAGGALVEGVDSALVEVAEQIKKKLEGET